jgi:hypothetical protein
MERGSQNANKMSMETVIFALSNDTSLSFWLPLVVELQASQIARMPK